MTVTNAIVKLNEAAARFRAALESVTQETEAGILKAFAAGLLSDDFVSLGGLFGATWVGAVNLIRIDSARMRLRPDDAWLAESRRPVWPDTDQTKMDFPVDRNKRYR